MRLVENTAPERREPRLVLQLNTGVGQAGKAFDAEILNLSKDGLLVRTDAELMLEEPFEVVLPHSGAVRAKVVWSADGMYGCSFPEPIGEEEIRAATEVARDDTRQGPRFGVDHETLGSRIKRLRNTRGFTMRGLAETVGVSKPTLWKWEGDQVRPRHDTMRRLAEALEVSELELAYGAPALGEASAIADDALLAGGSLADIVRASRKRIALAAGVDEALVEININWDGA